MYCDMLSQFIVFYILAGAVEIHCCCVWCCLLLTARHVLKFHNNHDSSQSLQCCTAHEIIESHECCGSDVALFHAQNSSFLFVSKHWHSTCVCKNFLTDQHSVSFHGLVLSVHLVVEFLAEMGAYTHFFHNFFSFHVCLVRYVIIYLPSCWGLFLPMCFLMLLFFF